MQHIPHLRSSRKLRWMPILVAALLCAGPAPAADIAPDHPLLGTWKVAIPQLDCVETYVFLRDGTTRVTSATEISESTYEITDKPSAGGFYRWTDTTVKNNGKKDCAGTITKPPTTVTHYVLFHHTRDIFFICQQERRDTCFGPFVRQKGQAT
jgi:hypothetical protein